MFQCCISQVEVACKQGYAQYTLYYIIHNNQNILCFTVASVQMASPSVTVPEGTPLLQIEVLVMLTAGSEIDLEIPLITGEGSGLYFVANCVKNTKRERESSYQGILTSPAILI